VDSGQWWPVDSGQWTVDSGQWRVESGEHMQFGIMEKTRTKSHEGIHCDIFLKRLWATSDDNNLMVAVINNMEHHWKELLNIITS
jgi:hypothetical protein